MSDFGSIHRPGIVVDYQNKPTNVTVAAARGIKRKMMQPFNKPGGTFIKKPKLAKPVEKMSLSKSPSKLENIIAALRQFTLFFFNSVHLNNFFMFMQTNWIRITVVEIRSAVALISHGYQNYQKIFINSLALIHPFSLNLDLGWNQNMYIFTKILHIILTWIPFLGVIFIVG